MIYKYIDDLRLMDKKSLIINLLIIYSILFASIYFIKDFHDKETIVIDNKIAAFNSMKNKYNLSKIAIEISGAEKEKVSLGDNLNKLKSEESELKNSLLYISSEISKNKVHWSKIINFINQHNKDATEIKFIDSAIEIHGKREFVPLLNFINKLENLSPFINVFYFNYSLDGYIIKIKLNEGI